MNIEYRCAIGASSRHDLFDGTLILSLCHRDPGVSGDGRIPGVGPPPGNLVTANVRDDLPMDFAVRYGNSPDCPRRLYSTGYGVRIAWDVDLRVRTSRLGVLMPNADPRPEINDGSLWHLASIIAMDRSIVDFEGPFLFPPYLWLTTSYQTYDEQWFPVEVDPNNATLGPVSFNPETKTAERMMHIRFVTRDPYRIAVPEYVPSCDVFEIPGLVVTNMPPMSPGAGPLAGAFTTQLTLSQPLPSTHLQAPDGLGEMDSLLINVVTSPYGWKLFTIQSIDNGDRTLVTVSSLSNLSNSYAIPPAPPCDAVRGVVQSRGIWRQRYCVVPFTGDAPPRIQQPFVQAQLIGGAGCPPPFGFTVPPVPPEPPGPPEGTPGLQACISTLPDWIHNPGLAAQYDVLTDASGTWTKPAGPFTFVAVVGFGSGGGGGGGQKNLSGDNTYGGASGGAGARKIFIWNYAGFPASVDYVIHQGGLGGAAMISPPDGGNGRDGTDGGESTLADHASPFTQIFFVGGGLKGPGGRMISPDPGGQGGSYDINGTVVINDGNGTNGDGGGRIGNAGHPKGCAECGGGAGTGDPLGDGGGSSRHGGSGGGCGGLVTVAPVTIHPPTAGGRTGTTTNGGGTGAPGVGLNGGDGGPGGAAAVDGTSSPGGDGGVPAGGGGGGGASYSGGPSNSAAGGHGARGELRIYVV